MRLLVLGPLACLLACSGPPAPDAALCQDVVTRLCQARSCPGVNEQLALSTTGDCQLTLLQRTGCDDDAFAFTEPSRERFISCRKPLVKRSTDPGKAPTCEEVATMVEDCPDVIDFLGGR
jgi:hypothetical protein